jgi:hypothetical protein
MKTKKKTTVLGGSWCLASCKYVLGAALSAAVLLPSCGRADNGVPSVLEFRHWGNGCPEGTAFGDITPSLDFEILLTSFGAATDSGKPSAAAKCDFRLRLSLPQGKKLRIAETFVQGFASIASLGAGLLRSSYNFAGLPREKWEWRLPAHGVLEDFSVQGQPSLFAWPGCGKPVEMVGSLQAQAVRGTDGKDSEIYIQNQVGRQSRMLWDWEVVDCTDADDVTPLEGPWQTHYTTAQGHTVSSAMSVFGSEGWLKLAVEGDAFTGSWGFGDADSPAKGTWSGTR